MRHLTAAPFRYGVAILAVAVAVSSGVIVFAMPDDAPPPPPARVNVDGVSSEQLEAGGIILLPPDENDAQGLSSAAALRSSSEARPTLTKTRQTVLARLFDNSSVPPIVDQLVWVISFDPSGSTSSGPFPGEGESSPGRPVAWSLAFIDAKTGEYLFAMEGGTP